MNYVIMVANIPFSLVITPEGDYFVQATTQQVYFGGSPLVVSLNPSIGPLTSVDFGVLYRTILTGLTDALNNGAIMQ